MGKIGLQTGKIVLMVLYRWVKVIQMLLATIAYIIIIREVDSISNAIAQFIAEQYHIESRLPLILSIVEKALIYYAAFSLFFWAFFHGHCLLVIHLIIRTARESSAPPSRPFLLTLPLVSGSQEEARVRYAHPSLHGQSTRIPVSLS